MIGSCQTMAVAAIVIRTYGWPGRRRHARTHTLMMMTIMATVPHCISWMGKSLPNAKSTGRGTPVTSGFAMRGETAPIRAW